MERVKVGYFNLSSQNKSFYKSFAFLIYLLNLLLIFNQVFHLHQISSAIWHSHQVYLEACLITEYNFVLNNKNGILLLYLRYELKSETVFELFSFWGSTRHRIQLRVVERRQVLKRPTATAPERNKKQRTPCSDWRKRETSSSSASFQNSSVASQSLFRSILSPRRCYRRFLSIQRMPLYPNTMLSVGWIRYVLI